MGMKEGGCLRSIEEPSVLISGCFEDKESLNLIKRETMIEGDEKMPLLKVAKCYIKITGAKTAVEVFQQLSSKCKESLKDKEAKYFKRCKKLAKKFSFKYIDPVILQKVQEEKECYYHIIDGTHRLVVYAVRLQLGEEAEYRKVKCVVYKKTAG